MAPQKTNIDARKKCSDRLIHHLVNAARNLKRRRVKLNSALKSKLRLPANNETQAQLITESLTPTSTAPMESPYLRPHQLLPGSRTELYESPKSCSSLINDNCPQNVATLRVRSPSLSPVVLPRFSGTDTSTPPGQAGHHRLSPGWHQSFSINAILARASSTPKKEDSSSLQSSVCSSFVTSSESGSTNMSPEYPEQYKENRVGCLHEDNETCPTDHRSPSSGHCHSCQHNNNTRRKMERTKFSKEDIQILNDYFWKDRYPSALEIEQLAKQLGYRVVQIKTWFQNKRASVSGTRQPKSQSHGQVMSYPPTPLSGRHQTMFLPVAKSLMENLPFHPALLARHHHPAAPSVNLVTPFPGFSATIDTRFASGASHFSSSSHSARVMPPSIVTHFPPVTPFHYFGNGFL